LVPWQDREAFRNCVAKTESNRFTPRSPSRTTRSRIFNSTAFIEFLLAALLTALREVSTTDQVGDQLTDQVKSLLKALNAKPLSAVECMQRLKLSHRPTLRANYLHPALEQGFIERTIPDKPNSRLQKYRLTPRGRTVLSSDSCMLIFLLLGRRKITYSISCER